LRDFIAASSLHSHEIEHRNGTTVAGEKPSRLPYNALVDMGKQSPGRLLGLDLGTRTIGVAVSDELGITAQGLPTIRRRNQRADGEALERIIRERGIAEIVLGNPLHMRGGETAGTERAASFAEKLRRRFGLPVHLWDERLTTAEAQRLLREAAVSSRRRAQVVDRMAAVLILQSFMERRKLQLDY
jgi:putative Holliday junction resolvase